MRLRDREIRIELLEHGLIRPSGKGASFLVNEDDFSGNVSIEENIPSDGKVTITVSKFNTK